MVDPTSMVAAHVANSPTVQHGVSRVIAGEQNPTRPNVVDLLEEQNKILFDLLQSSSDGAQRANEHVEVFVPAGDYTLIDLGYNHISFFSAVAFPIIIKIAGLPPYTGTLKQGWTQVDLVFGAVISSGDTNRYAVLISYRDNAVGIPL